MKKLICLLLIAIQIVLLVNTCYAQEVAPCADEVFTRVYINLTTGKVAYYTGVTYNTYQTIKVTDSYLQKLIDNEWITIASITVSGTGVNTFSFTTSADCSGVISTGTYRVVATFSADGYTVTRTSNERTY